MSERSTQQIIDDARRLDEFLKDEAIQAVFSRMERRYYEEFVAAIDSSEKRVMACAKANVLRDFERECRSMKDAGDFALASIKKELKKPTSE